MTPATNMNLRFLCGVRNFGSPLPKLMVWQDCKLSLVCSLFLMLLSTSGAIKYHCNGKDTVACSNSGKVKENSNSVKRGQITIEFTFNYFSAK
jgi:hypothetical protein